jgi:hypothetical protein
VRPGRCPSIVKKYTSGGRFLFKFKPREKDHDG